ncbi:MAG: DOPA 4,5-dioxygenase family protein [Mariprofundaceae bacterium]|nr:DOPA 4,5-dioxygenase family protein [Mariprofundaceae bacterium]
MYHAHIYYNTENKEQAQQIHQQILHEELPIDRLGFMHDEPMGPHPQGMFQIQFIDCYLMNIMEWLERNRINHSVLIHPMSDDLVADHRDEAIWLGEALELDFSQLKK